MEKARISEIFMSIQGEGLYFGIPQLFIRFDDCNLSCAYCDTKLKPYKGYTVKGLMRELSKFKEPHHSISLTGGEPLLQVDFIESFLLEYEKSFGKTVYLETNGTLPDALARIIDNVDIIAMDVKLPSSTGGKSFWNEHEKFLWVARWKKIFVKAVVTQNTSSVEIVALSDMVQNIGRKIPVILQPATELKKENRVERKSLEHYRALLQDSLKNVEIIPQVHKLLGVK